MPLRIRYANHQEISDLAVSPTDTIGQLRRRIGERIHLHWSRIELRGSDPSDRAAAAAAPRFTGELKPLSAFGKALTDTTSVVWVKDLGAQFSYRGVFLLEYGGPLALMLLFALRPAFLYGAAAGALPLVERLAPALAGALPSEASAQWAPFVQCLAVAMWLLHYLKRELETCVRGGGCLLRLGAAAPVGCAAAHALFTPPTPSFPPLPPLLPQPVCAQVQPPLYAHL
jgi:hypothetical protein